MCGRTACTLAPDDIVAACTYTDKNGIRKQPQWVDVPNGQKYYPSYNKAPTSVNPVIMSSCHVDTSESKLDCSHIIMPMRWGMIPSWHKGDPNKIPYETNNCRAEGMLEKRTYKVPLKKGNRCVVLADGFFEWHTTKEGKQPFLFHFPQPENVKFPLVLLETGKKEWINCDIKEEIRTEDTIKNEILGSDTDVVQVKKENTNGDGPEWAGPRLLTMAGIFDIWHPPDGFPPIFSYSIITVPSSADMQWCHHRMPAMLTTDEEIQDWLDFANVPLEKTVSLIKPKECLTYHPVSKAVNNSKHQAVDCVTPVELGKTKSSASSNFMLSWLKSGSPAKKRKI